MLSRADFGISKRELKVQFPDEWDDHEDVFRNLKKRIESRESASQPSSSASAPNLKKRIESQRFPVCGSAHQLVSESQKENWK